MLPGLMVVSLVTAVPVLAGSVAHDVVVSEDPVDWSPNMLDGRVYAVEEVGDRVIVGGSFTQYQAASGGPVLTRPYIVAFDARTGAIDTAFDPLLDGTVEAIEAAGDGTSVFVGGQFRDVNGSDHRNLVKLDLATGNVVEAFTARPDRKVLDLEADGDRLYLAGTFGAVNGEPRTVVAAVDATSGAVDADVDLTFSGAYGGSSGAGTLAVQKLALTPDGMRLVAIGNFNTVAGLSRHQVVVLDVASRPAQVADWHTSRFQQDLCNPIFSTYMRNVDISPDGGYMTIVTTGAYRRDQLCDTASRWELDATGSDLQPTWVNWVGGDTLYGVEATGEAVYIGGHNRWVNNPFVGDAPGPGAVPREGLAALDPRNGMPFTWDPGRARGVGVFDMLSTDAGVWMGSDTDRWDWEYHGRLAMFPRQGGTTVPPADPGPVPGELFRAPTRVQEVDPAYLHRVNAGGGTLDASDHGIDWSSDAGADSPLRTSGSNTASWGPVGTVDGTVPAATPAAVFSTERWDPSSPPEMEWNLPVEAGREVEVRLYLANRCGCTSDVGQRVFDVSIEGSVVLDDYDIVADVGHDVGTMKTFTVVSDGTIDVDFGHVVENTLVNAIEIVDPALLGSFSGPDPAPQVHRVNAGGSAISASDYGADWSDDSSGTSPYRNSGSNVATWSGVGSVDGTVPSSTPSDVFASERWDPGGGEELQWDFPVEAGRDLEVRLYFANRCGCTSGVGQRVFDVSIEGSVVLDDYDIVADVGHDVGTMKSWTLASDGNVDVDFAHVVENPLVNAIEIIDLDRQATWEPPPPLPLEGRDFDGTTFGPATEVASDDDWSQARGSFMLSGRLYTAWADGSVTARDFDGNSLGASTVLDLYGLTSNEFPVSSLSGMSFDPISGRLYYTVRGVSTLFYRYFEPESEIVGANTFQATGNTGGVDWAGVRGLHLDVEDGLLYFGSEDGNLRSVGFHQGSPVDGTLTTISGPEGGDGETWQSQGLFTLAPAGYDMPNVAPEPNVVTACDGRTCVLGSTGTKDAEGPVVGFSWAFDDGSTASGPRAEHTFETGGTHEVTLTVTDAEGGSASVTAQVNPTQLDPTIDVQCIDLTCTVDGSRSDDAGGTVAHYAWEFGDGATATGPTAEHTYGGVGPHTIQLSVTDADGVTSRTTRSVLLDDAPAGIALLGVSSVTDNLPGFEVQVPDTVRGGDSLLLFVSVNRATTGTAPPAGVEGWTELESVVAGDLRTTAWHKLAEPGDEGRTVVVSVDGWTKADVVLLAYEGTSTTTPVAVFDGAPETTYQAAHTTPVVTSPADGAWVVSYWADRTSNATDWVEPAGQTVRHEAFGPGAGRVSALGTDTASGVSTGAVGGLTATSNESNDDATMWTIALAPRGYDADGATPLVAVAEADCTGLECTFDGSRSAGGEGGIVSYEWAFSDGSTDSGVTVQRTFAEEGLVEATLTVTDASGAQETDTVSVEPVVAPTASFAASCTELTCQFDGTASSDESGAIQDWAWTFGDGQAGSGATVEHTYGATGTYSVELTVTDDEGDTATTSADVTVSGQPATAVDFVGVSGTNGNASSFTVAVPGGTLDGDALLLFASANKTGVLPADPSGPVSGWTLLDTVTAGSMQTRVWHKVATATDATSSVTVDMSSFVKADVLLTAYTGTDRTSPVHAFAGVAESVYGAEHTTPEVSSSIDAGWVVSYWSDKTSGTTAWTPPSGETVRYEGYGIGSGRISALATDRGPVAAGTHGGVTAVADETNHKATMWTIVLAPNS